MIENPAVKMRKEKFTSKTVFIRLIVDLVDLLN